MVDDSIGITAKEQHIFEYLLETGKKNHTILIVNKLDIKWKTPQYDTAISEYYHFGFPAVVGISAKKDINTSEIRKEIQEIYRNKNIEYHQKEIPEENENLIHLAILGKPNAGKSTLLNTLSQKQLSKIEDKAGTTRDYVFADIQIGKQEYRIYDTAGIKKKGKMRDIERIAYQKTLSMLKYIKPMVIFMVDADAGMTHRDMSLLEEINIIGLPIIVMLNKIDLLSSIQKKTLIKKTQSLLDFAKYIPILPLVAKS
ncbi:MAG: GTP-binding protein [bacterium]|nr:GTP-binding protein [bacterium]